MLHPSYSELIDRLNIEQGSDENAISRYSVVIAAAKRARQLVDGAPSVTSDILHDKAVSVAVKEISEGKIKLNFNDEGQSGKGKGANASKKSLGRARGQAVVSLNFDISDEALADDYGDFESPPERDGDIFTEEADINDVLEVSEILSPVLDLNDVFAEDGFGDDNIVIDDLLE